MATKKIQIMGTMPQSGADLSSLIGINREEYLQFVKDTAKWIIDKFHAKALA